MSRQLLKSLVLAAILGLSWYFGLPKPATPGAPHPASAGSRTAAAPSQTWGRSETLADHFARHGRDFSARDADDYAAQAAAFLQKAKTAGFPAKRDTDGSLRVFDWTTGAFGAYNRDGTTRTYFKPGNREYFDRQPGTRVDLRTER